MTPWIVTHLWLIAGLPLMAAGAIAVTPRRYRGLAASLAIGSMAVSFCLACKAFLATVTIEMEGPWRQHFDFNWIQMGNQWLKLGWVLDPLTAIMLVMVTFVALLIFIYSVGYMAHDENFTRFFGFLSLFTSAMLGVVMANSLLLLFMSWELVGLASYLLIGFWFQKPSAAAAAKKAFITTRIGDIGFFLGMLWLYQETGTLLFYDHGQGCLEQSALTAMVSRVTSLGMAATTGIGLLLFCGAAGKSGQVPLHVWLPDAMEGPTPVSALIHAATMVAAGVFLMARVYPLLAIDAAGIAGGSTALAVVTWVGAITAVFAASIAVAQTDIKRILAYSTVSQLGFMMMGIGTGGVAVGMFHLITHAFFKALLFLGAGSVIHGCHEEQDIRRLGGVKKYMPLTFATYAVGMMALSGVPIFFSGFWSKDEILHAAHAWKGSHWPFYLGIFGAWLTAFYMTRQMCYVFFGSSRAKTAGARGHSHSPSHPHESPSVMTAPLVILAVASILLGFVGTPAWPWFQEYFEGLQPVANAHGIFEWETLSILLLSCGVVSTGLATGWWFYGRKPIQTFEQADPLAEAYPRAYELLENKYYVDELYETSFVRAHAAGAQLCDWLDRILWNGVVRSVSSLILGISWLSRFFDEFIVNGGFNQSCQKVRQSGGIVSRLQNGRVQSYLSVLSIALVVLFLTLVWGMK